MKIGKFKNDTEEFKLAREELRREEIALRDQVERVAAMRRELPPSGEVEDYNFKSCPEGKPVKMSALFKDAKMPLIVQHYMFGGAQSKPCPMCSLWVDGIHGISGHLAEVVNYAVIAEAEPDKLYQWFTSKGWDQLDYYSSDGTSFKSDFYFEDEEKEQYSGYSIFSRDNSGTITHRYSASAIMDDGEFRGMDLMSPLWNLLDLTPKGRAAFMPSLKYN